MDRQIKANRANTLRQLATQRVLHRETQKANAHKMQRAEQLEALTFAVGALNELRVHTSRMITKQAIPKTPATLQARQTAQKRYAEAVVKSNEAGARLKLLGMTDAVTGFKAATAQFKSALNDTGTDRLKRFSELRATISTAQDVLAAQLNNAQRSSVMTPNPQQAVGPRPKKKRRPSKPPTGPGN